MVRFAKPEDLEFLKHAWDVCFDDPKDFIDWNFKRNFSFSDTLIAESEGQPASNMQLMPHRIRLRNQEYDINYVSGVATLPEYRMRGLVREMFAFAFLEMCKRNHPISLLVPFKYEFYEKFGYKQCYEKIFRHTDSLPRHGLLTGEDLGIGLIRRLDTVYQKAMADKTGYVLRTQETWQRILEDLLFLSKGCILFHQTDGQDDGYALISPGEKNGWEIHELLGPCVLSFSEEKKPFAMARILDVKRILLDLTEDFDGCWRVKIIDENIAANNMTVKLTHGSVVPCSNYDTEINIKQLTQLIFGFAEDFTGTGLFPKTDPYLNMIF